MRECVYSIRQHQSSSPNRIAKGDRIGDDIVKLLTFDENQFPKLAGCPIKDIATCTLYYLHSGRNAWHSTWVMQYEEGCMHSDAQSAKESAERQRTQGSRFYVSELPALLIQCSKGFLAVTEINTNQPLSNYVPDAHLGQNDANANTVNEASDTRLARGVHIRRAVLSFHRDSRFWSRRPAIKNSVIIVGTSETAVKFVPCKTDFSTVFQSYSNGISYLLGWREVPNKRNVNAAQVFAIAARFAHDSAKRATSSQN